MYSISKPKERVQQSDGSRHGSEGKGGDSNGPVNPMEQATWNKQQNKGNSRQLVTRKPLTVIFVWLKSFQDKHQAGMV